MKILFLSISDRLKLYNITFPIIQKYCSKYNYDFKYLTSSLDNSRHISWSKIPFIIDEMDSSNNSYDFYIWLDDDIYLTNFNLDIKNIVIKYHFNCLLFSKDVIDECPLNAGIMVCKNNLSTKKLLKDVYDLVDECGTRYKHNWEQNAFIKYFTNYMSNSLDITIIPHREIQSFYRNYQLPDKYHWKPGDFSAHITGMSLSDKINIINKIQSII